MGCKVLSCQIWILEKNSTAPPTPYQARVAQDYVQDNWIILKVLQTTTLQPFDLQKFILALKKDLNLSKNIVLFYDTGNNQDRCALSK